MNILYNMNTNLQLTSNDVSICYKDNCIHSKGASAIIIALGITILFTLIGITSLFNSLK